MLFFCLAADKIIEFSVGLIPYRNCEIDENFVHLPLPPPAPVAVISLMNAPCCERFGYGRTSFTKAH